MLSSSLSMSSSILALLFAVVVLSNMSSKTTSLSTGEIICKGNKGNGAEKFGIEIKPGEQKTGTTTKNGHLSLLFMSKISVINPFKVCPYYNQNFNSLAHPQSLCLLPD